MINKESNESIALNTTALNKSKSIIKHSPEDIIERINEQDCVENLSNKLYENSTHSTDAVTCSNVIFRPNSPSQRSYNNPKLSRSRPYQWRPIDSIRKSRSTASPAILEAKSNRQHRGESVSTPDLADNGPKEHDFDEDKFRCQHQVIIQLNRAAICYDNIRWICVFLNFVILILSFLYFGSAIAFMYSKEVLLLIMKDSVYTFMILFFHVISVFFWIISISGLYILWKKPRKTKTHALFTLIIVIASSLTIFLQNSTEKNIESNLESQMLTSINFSNHHAYKKSWDYLHDTFKCCGVTGFLDWCYYADFYSKIRGIKKDNYFGAYTCSLPTSCCENIESENNEKKKVSCIELMKTKKMRNAGCLSFIRREIHHLGKMYRVITSCAIGALIFLTIMSIALFVFFLK